MCKINNNNFLEQIADKIVLENVTKYCNICYRELKEGENIYYDINKYIHLCKECACKISQETQSKYQENYQENSLF